MNALETALIDVCDIAYSLTAYPNGLSEFAFSPDLPDRWHAEAVRNAAKKIAANVAPLSDAEVAQVHAALEFVCAGDEYAAKEVAGRFLSAVRRLRVVTAIKKHPRAGKFATLVAAIERGKFTPSQWDFARTLAAEAA